MDLRLENGREGQRDRRERWREVERKGVRRRVERKEAWGEGRSGGIEVRRRERTGGRIREGRVGGRGRWEGRE